MVKVLVVLTLVLNLRLVLLKRLLVELGLLVLLQSDGQPLRMQLMVVRVLLVLLELLVRREPRVVMVVVMGTVRLQELLLVRLLLFRREGSPLLLLQREMQLLLLEEEGRELCHLAGDGAGVRRVWRAHPRRLLVAEVATDRR